MVGTYLKKIINKSLKYNNMKNVTQYKYNNELMGKGRLVLNCIRTIVEQRKNITLVQLQNIFPKSLNGPYEVIVKLNEGKKLSEVKQRYFTNDVIKLKDGTRIVVTNQWGIHNIGTILQVFKTYNQTWRTVYVRK